MKIKNLKNRLAVMGLTVPLVLTGCSSSSKEEEVPKAEIQTEIESSDNSAVKSTNSGTVKYTTPKSKLNPAFFDHEGEKVESDGLTYIGAHMPACKTTEYKGYSYENGININDLYFIRLDGKVYLSTRVTDVDKNNIITKYYSLENGEFLGQVLNVNWYSRSINEVYEDVFEKNRVTGDDYSVDRSLMDYNYFSGEYGLGKNLPFSAIIPAKEIFETSKLTKEQVDNFINDPLQLIAYIETQYSYPSYKKIEIEKYEFGMWHVWCVLLGDVERWMVYRKEEIKTESIRPLRYTIITENGEKEIIGYRSSWDEKDLGYNYIYDMVTSKMVDISKYEVINIDTTVIDSVSRMRNYDRIRNPYDEYYSINDLYVLNTDYLIGDYINELEKYYIITRSEFNYDIYYYYSTFGENNDFKISADYNCSSVYLMKDDKCRSSSVHKQQQYVIELEECFIKNGMFEYIKDTYTETEIIELLEKLREKELKPLNDNLENEEKLDFLESISSVEINDEETLPETEMIEEKIALDNIAVIDATGDNVICNDTTQKYFILTPIKEVGDFKTYSNFDGSIIATLDTYTNFIMLKDTSGECICSIDNLQKGNDFIKSLEDVLTELELDDMKHDEYTVEDITDLDLYINGKTKQNEEKLDFQEPISSDEPNDEEESLETEMIEEKIALGNIAVIDATGDNVLWNDTTQKYFIISLTPIKEVGDFKTYSNFDGSIIATLDTYTNFIMLKDTSGECICSIDNLQKGNDFIKSLEDLLTELELDDMKYDEYTIEDITDLDLYINGKTKQLVLTK